MSSHRTTAKSERRSPGRPARGANSANGQDLKDKILDQAELAFAELGFEGANLRDIASRAEVSQALIGYYFGSKVDLFEECFRRRGGIISGNRHVLLDRLVESIPNPSVEDVVYAYLKPQWDMKYSVRMVLPSWPCRPVFTRNRRNMPFGCAVKSMMRR